MPLFSPSRKSESGDATPAAGAAAAYSTRGTIGELLRETRQSYGGDVAQIATILRIRPAYLTAIEEGRYAGLPAPVYALGFVRAYANHLGLDGDEAVRRFKQETVDFEAPRGLSFPMPLAERSIPGGTMLLAALILAFCGYGLWYYVSTGERARPERVSPVPAELAKALPAPPTPALPPAPSPAQAAPAIVPPQDASAPAAAPAAVASPPPDTPPASLPQPPVASVVAASPPPATSFPPPGVTILPHPPEAPASPPPPSAAAPAPAVAAAPPATPTTAPAADQPHVYGAAVDVPSRITIYARKDSWVQIHDGDKILVGRLLHAGDTYRVPDRPGLLMDTGNGAGLDIEVDGNKVPSLGAAVRHNVTLEPSRLVAGTAVADQVGGAPIH